MAAGIRAAGSSTSSEVRAEPFAQDHLLAQRGAQGDARAQKQLALRLIGRIRRAAHALMGGAIEADDATHHALIEVLRSLSGYSGAGSLEAWADRLSARSIVRYARAVRARASVPSAPPKSSPPAALASGVSGASEAGGDGVDPASAAKEPERPERAARTLEEFLRQLPSAPREALLLREVFSFDLVQTAQLLRLSASSLRDQLWRARQSLFERTLGEPLSAGEPLPESITRWFALRDGELKPTSDLEQAKAAEARLNDDPAVRKLQRELRSLSQFLDAGRFNRPGAKDKKLVEGALSAVRVSSVTPARELLREHGRNSLEWRAAHWVHPVSIGLCAVLVVGSFVALALHKPGPRSARKDQGQGGAAQEKPVKPTVQALSTAHSVDRRARLQRAGQPLSEGAVMREGDIVSATSRPGCFVLSPPVDVCLAGGSEARIARLSLAERSVELLSGRTTVSVERVADAARPAESVPFAIVVGELRAEVTDADFGVEIDTDTVVVRALRGTMLLSADGETHLLAPAQSAIYRWHQHKLEVVPQLIEKARRDWDLLATRSSSSGSDRAQARAGASSARDRAPALSDEQLVDGGGLDLAALAQELTPEPESEPAEDAPPEALMERAHDLARQRRWQEAVDAYALLSVRYPRHALTRDAWVLQGELLAERLQRPTDALNLFDRYLASHGGALDIRARYGRIVALRLLDRPVEERAAVAQFLSLYRSTPQARVLLSAVEPEASAEAEDLPVAAP